jgi:hypothetical protein
VYGDGAESLLYIAIALICLASILTVYVVIKSLITQPNFINLEETIMKQLKLYIENENINIYNPRGLLWEVADSFYWLELKI